MPAILALNKIDTLQNKEDMLPKLAAFQQLYNFEEIIPISVTENDGLDILLNAIKAQAQEGPHFFPEDTLTDQPEKVIAGEIIREKVLRNMRDEIPHGIAVIIEKMREREGKDIIDIDATILCEARTEIEAFMDCKINLQCWVKVRTDWRNSPTAMKDLGFN